MRGKSQFAKAGLSLASSLLELFGGVIGAILGVLAGKTLGPALAAVASCDRLNLALQVAGLMLGFLVGLSYFSIWWGNPSHLKRDLRLRFMFIFAVIGGGVLSSVAGLPAISAVCTTAVFGIAGWVIGGDVEQWKRKRLALSNLEHSGTEDLDHDQ